MDIDFKEVVGYAIVLIIVLIAGLTAGHEPAGRGNPDPRMTEWPMPELASWGFFRMPSGMKSVMK